MKHNRETINLWKKQKIVNLFQEKSIRHEKYMGFPTYLVSISNHVLHTWYMNTSYSCYSRRKWGYMSLIESTCHSLRVHVPFTSAKSLFVFFLNHTFSVSFKVFDVTIVQPVQISVHHLVEDGCFYNIDLSRVKFTASWYPDFISSCDDLPKDTCSGF